MSWGAVIVGVASVAGGAYASRQAGRAADAQGRAGDAAIAEQGRQFDTLLGLTANQRAIGNQALNALGSIYGYEPAPYFEGTGLDAQEMNSFDPQAYLAANPDVAENEFFRQYPEEHWLRHGQHEGRARPTIGQRRGQSPDGQRGSGRFSITNNGLPIVNTTMAMPDGSVRQVGWLGRRDQVMPDGAQPNAVAGPTSGNQLAGPNYSSFYQSPDYQFRLNQGLNAVQNSAAAQGGLYSGNALRGINEFAQGSAASEFGNYVNRQLALAGMGQAATTQAGNAAMTTGTNIGNLLMSQGNARASGIIGQTNSVVGGMNDLASLYGMWRGGFFDRPAGGGS